MKRRSWNTTDVDCIVVKAGSLHYGKLWLSYIDSEYFIEIQQYLAWFSINIHTNKELYNIFSIFPISICMSCLVLFIVLTNLELQVFLFSYLPLPYT